MNEHPKPIDDDTLHEWIRQWGESYDDVRMRDTALDVANRIADLATGKEYDDSTADWTATFKRLEQLVAPALERLDGDLYAGSRFIADEIESVSLGDPSDDGDLWDESVSLATTPGFMIRSEAAARNIGDEPSLNEIITAADADYRRAVVSGGQAMRHMWRDAAVYDWEKLMAEPRRAGEQADDAGKLAVIAVAMQYAPQAMSAMIAASVLDPDGHDLDALRRIARTPEADVDVDRLFTDLVEHADRDATVARDHAAWGILDPIAANADTNTAWRVESLLAMFDLAEGDLATAASHARDAIGYNPDDRIASGVLDRIPDPDNGVAGAGGLWLDDGRSAPTM
ncbi:hypothetical protein BLEM_2059 [Bifidobacterium lemurum]|uniref:Uncharacterized protein n=1 Tax=Bifidobacterium lemurum TaxID=1603886 RepID=A0A261FL55_9BIFI|nr:hypothetical protein [Bifidobacterium lemurum]OZG59884.1 hypothetical protein BLEM_2059 [Bifidobacterium lemurum]QOL33914.1 hypothetical protein BL8807_09120 [Bifidobacterium lemurum]